MGGFKASLINEIDKMYKKKKAVVTVILSLLAIVAAQLLVSGIRYGFGPRVTSGDVFPLWVLKVFAISILPLFTALVAIDMFSGEFSHNLMKIILVRPATRFKLFSAKITAIAFFVAANLFVVMILSTITGVIFNRGAISLDGFGKIILSYAVTIFPVMALALAVVFLSNFFKSGLAAFFLTALIYIISLAIGFVFSQYSILFITTMLGWYELWIADAASIPYKEILREFIILLGCGIMFFTAGFYLFDKKDL